MIVVDGNDGLGKSTLVAALRTYGYLVSDRGLPTRATLDMSVLEERNSEDDYIILDGPEELSRQRLAMAGKDLDEHWHQEAVLTLYRRKFRDVAAALGVPLFDATLDPTSLHVTVQTHLLRLNRLHLHVLTLQRLTPSRFAELPLIAEGESKVVRDAGNGQCVIEFKPTIYSHTANRAGIVPGSEVLRLRAAKVFTDVLQQAGVDHAYIEINDRFVLSRLVEPPPIEVIVKAFHTGTSKHRYVGFDAVPIRSNHPHYGGARLTNDGPYPETIVRFDWRNPLRHPSTGSPCCDEVMADAHANWFIDVAAARTTAVQAFNALGAFLLQRDVLLYDLCLLLTADGRTVFGEVSQDCGRFRHSDLGGLDKDVWRTGGSSESVLSKWQLLLDLIEG